MPEARSDFRLRTTPPAAPRRPTRASPCGTASLAPRWATTCTCFFPSPARRRRAGGGVAEHLGEGRGAQAGQLPADRRARVPAVRRHRRQPGGCWRGTVGFRADAREPRTAGGMAAAEQRARRAQRGAGAGRLRGRADAAVGPGRDLGADAALARSGRRSGYPDYEQARAGEARAQAEMQARVQAERTRAEAAERSNAELREQLRRLRARR